MPGSPAHWRVQPRVPRALRVAAWLSFIAEVLIIGTGGAVRLTGSGLGCSEWPLCTPDSLIPTEELGIHGIIEFGNRTITGVVGALALAVLLMALHNAGGRRALVRTLWFALGGLVLAGVTYAAAPLLSLPEWTTTLAVLLLTTIVAAVFSLSDLSGPRDLVALAWVVFIGVIAQAFVGGITVLTGLNPYIVGFHYVASLVLVCVTAAFLVRMHETPGRRERVVPSLFTIGMHVTGLALAATIVFGVLTTGSGPHSGDVNVKRDGFDATVLAHVHSWPGYILAGLLVILTVWAYAARLRPCRWMLALMVGVALQIFVGVWQARTGLPALLVGIHMVFAALSAAAYTVAVLRMKRPVKD